MSDALCSQGRLTGAAQLWKQAVSSRHGPAHSCHRRGARTWVPSALGLNHVGQSELCRVSRLVIGTAEALRTGTTGAATADSALATAFSHSCQRMDEARRAVPADLHALHLLTCEHVKPASCTDGVPTEKACQMQQSAIAELTALLLELALLARALHPQGACNSISGLTGATCGLHYTQALGAELHAVNHRVRACVGSSEDTRLVRRAWVSCKDAAALQRTQLSQTHSAFAPQDAAQAEGFLKSCSTAGGQALEGCGSSRTIRCGKHIRGVQYLCVHSQGAP